MKPFPTDKGTDHNQALLLRENDQTMRDERKVAEVMNKYFVNIVETVSGKSQEMSLVVKPIMKLIKNWTFEDHPRAVFKKEERMKRPIIGLLAY